MASFLLLNPDFLFYASQPAQNKKGSDRIAY
jgi:hypothetical protein